MYIFCVFLSVFLFFFFFPNIQNLFNNKAGSGVSFYSPSWPVRLWLAGASAPWSACRVRCGSAASQGPCRNAWTPLGPCEDQRAGRCHSLWGSPGPASRRWGSCPWPWRCDSRRGCSHLLDLHVISYSPYSHSDFPQLHLPDHPEKGQRWPVDAWTTSSAPPGWRWSSLSGQKPVQLDP